MTPTRIANTGALIATIAGLTTQHPADAGPDPASPAEPQEHRLPGAEHGSETRERLDGLVRARGTRDEDRRGLPWPRPARPPGPHGRDPSPAGRSCRPSVPSRRSAGRCRPSGGRRSRPSGASPSRYPRPTSAAATRGPLTRPSIGTREGASRSEGGRLVRSAGPSSPSTGAARVRRRPADLRPRHPRSRDRRLLGGVPSRRSWVCSVALVDAYKIGGTCLHIGCIPTKAMLESADLLRPHQARRRVRDRGRGAAPSTRRPSPRDATRSSNGSTRACSASSARTRSTTSAGAVASTGRRASGSRRIDDADQPTGERVLEGRDIILATGSRVKSLPGLEPDGERILTSDDILRSDDVPASLIVVGAGAVGVEFASYYADMGTEVTVLEYLPAVVPARGRRGQQGDGARVHASAASRVITGARFDPSAVAVDGDGRPPHGRQGGRGARRAASPSGCSSPRVAPRTPTASASRRPRRSWSGPSSRSTPRCDGGARTSTPSATSSAGCGSRTSRPTRASPRSTRSPARRSSRSTT